MREIEEGHGSTDVSCVHGSRWIWWPGPDGKGRWEQVVWCSDCGCSDPPRPFKRKQGDVPRQTVDGVK